MADAPSEANGTNATNGRDPVWTHATPTTSDAFDAPTWDEMCEIIEAATDLIEAVSFLFERRPVYELSLEHPPEFDFHVAQFLQAAVTLRDMLGPPGDRPCGPAKGWPFRVLTQLSILHYRIDEFWTGTELAHVPDDTLDAARAGRRARKQDGPVTLRYYLGWTGCDSVYRAIEEAAGTLRRQVFAIEHAIGTDAVADRPGLTAAAPPSGNVAAVALDFAALAAELRKARKRTQANLVEYMADKQEATVEDVAERVHSDGETHERTVRANANRTNDSLAELGAPLSFRVASARVFREISPK